LFSVACFSLFLYLLYFSPPLTFPFYTSPLLLLQARQYYITVTIARKMTGTQKKEGNQYSPSNKLVQEPEGNAGNRYSDPDSKKQR
jgi:hypothetical protein